MESIGFIHPLQTFTWTGHFPSLKPWIHHLLPLHFLCRWQPAPSLADELNTLSVHIPCYIPMDFDCCWKTFSFSLDFSHQLPKRYKKGRVLSTHTIQSQPQFPVCTTRSSGSESYFHKTKCLAQIYLLKQQMNFYSVYNLGQAEISIFETSITTFPNGKRICLEPLTWVATISLTTESGKLG